MNYPSYMFNKYEPQTRKFQDQRTKKINPFDHFNRKEYTPNKRHFISGYNHDVYVNRYKNDYKLFDKNWNDGSDSIFLKNDGTICIYYL